MKILEKYELVEKLGLLLNTEIKNDFDYLLPGQIPGNKEKAFISGIRTELTNHDIDAAISNASNLIFTLTENCNLNCAYCAYSGKYHQERTHSSKKMTFETAAKAVELFFSYISKPTRTLNNRQISFGFYGGEPLLEFDLLKRIFKFVRDLSQQRGLTDIFDISFTISTNGTMLDNEKIDYLASNNIRVAVSIDGPQENHDQFRVTTAGNGSWEKIIANLERFKEKHPGFYNENVSFLCTVHPLYNGQSIDEFFSSQPLLFNPDKVSFNSLKRHSLKEEEKQRIEKEENNFPPSRRHMEKSLLAGITADRFNINKLEPGIKFTGTCFPGGKKFFIGADGKIHICESISGKFPIGDVYNGFDYDTIRGMLHRYNEAVIDKKCWECEVWFMCNECLATSLNRGSVRLNCQKNEILKMLEYYLRSKELRDETSHNHITLDTARDYLDFLR